jgi:hypothetical protein
MAKPRMDLSAFVGKLLEEQDGDVLREGMWDRVSPPVGPAPTDAPWRRMCDETPRTLLK